MALNFSNTMNIKPSFLMNTVFALNSIMNWLEIVNETNILDESYGLDTSNYYSLTPNWSSIFESKDHFDEICKLKYDSSSSDEEEIQDKNEIVFPSKSFQIEDENIYPDISNF